jgi:hypothetical protein
MRNYRVAFAHLMFRRDAVALMGSAKAKDVMPKRRHSSRLCASYGAPYDKLSPRKRQNVTAFHGTKPWPSEFPGQRMAQ